MRSVWLPQCIWHSFLWLPATRTLLFAISCRCQILQWIKIFINMVIHVATFGFSWQQQCFNFYEKAGQVSCFVGGRRLCRGSGATHVVTLVERRKISLFVVHFAVSALVLHHCIEVRVRVEFTYVGMVSNVCVYEHEVGKSHTTSLLFMGLVDLWRES